jgi:hypothetical protein
MLTPKRLRLKQITRSNVNEKNDPSKLDFNISHNLEGE